MTHSNNMTTSLYRILNNVALSKIYTNICNVKITSSLEKGIPLAQEK